MLSKQEHESRLAFHPCLVLFFGSLLCSIHKKVPSLGGDSKSVRGMPVRVSYWTLEGRDCLSNASADRWKCARKHSVMRASLISCTEVVYDF